MIPEMASNKSYLGVGVSNNGNTDESINIMLSEVVQKVRLYDRKKVEWTQKFLKMSSNKSS